MALPVALRTDTIWECVFEARFAAGNPSMADVLPGMLFDRLRHYVNTAQQLPASSIPQAIRDQDDNLKYQGTHALIGKELSVILGPRNVAISFARPYLGWGKVRPRILECLDAVNKTGLAGRAERCAIKYVNVLTFGRDAYDLSQLKVKLSLDDLPTTGPVVIRAEVPLNGCTAVVEVLTSATAHDVRADRGDQHGVILAVDTIKVGPFDDFFAKAPDLLEAVHNTEKQIFFSLLTKETLEKLGPLYE